MYLFGASRGDLLAGLGSWWFAHILAFGQGARSTFTHTMASMVRLSGGYEGKPAKGLEPQPADYKSAKAACKSYFSMEQISDM
jgi:hypothetical protein